MLSHGVISFRSSGLSGPSVAFSRSGGKPLGGEDSEQMEVPTKKKGKAAVPVPKVNGSHIESH